MRIDLEKCLKFTLIICLFSGLYSCTKYQEEAPFFDGLYLQYNETFSKSERPEDIIWERKIVYQFSELENGDYHLTQTVNTIVSKKINKKIEPVPFPQTGDNLKISKQGIVLEGGESFNFVNEYPSYLWLPADKRKKGSELVKAVKKVEGRQKWKGLDVFMVRNMFGDEYYYDTETGFLVGSKNLRGKLRMILADTNHDELKVSLPQ